MNASRYKYKYFQLWSIITLKPGFLIFSHGNDLNNLGRIQSYSRLFSLLDFLTERPTPRSNISIPTKARLDQGTGLNQWLFFRYSSISSQTKPPTGYCPRVKSQESSVKTSPRIRAFSLQTPLLNGQNFQILPKFGNGYELAFYLNNSLYFFFLKFILNNTNSVFF